MHFHLIITGGNSSELMQFKEQMKSKFQMGDLGKLHFYLGLEVNQSSEGIAVSQSVYAMKILSVAGLIGSNSCQMEVRLKQSKLSIAQAVDPTEYRKIVGALR
jgi:hypothetical protein